MSNEMHAAENTALIQLIRERMRAEHTGMITFRTYMEFCLYHPEYGYYMNSEPKVGLQGDFYTSSHIGTIMGEMLAHEIAKYWSLYGDLNNYQLIEWGGGTGRLAGQILDELEKAYPDYYRMLNYVIIDKSAYHRGLQNQLSHHHTGKIKIYTPQDWGTFKLSERAVILSNELLDAFPVHRLQYTQSQFHEIMVGWDEENGQFMESLRTLSPEDPLCELLHSHRVPDELKEGQLLELNPAIAPWIRSASDALHTGMLITIDYGDLAEHLYAPNRMRGTYMCYYRHQGHDNPYLHVGRQDITAHVNFDACIEAGVAAGLTDWTFRSQRQFLMQAGVLERLTAHQESDPFHPIVKRNRAIRSILLGDGMGETFKVLIQKKGDPA